MRILLFLVLSLTFMASTTKDAEACSCVQQTTAQYAKAASRIVFAKADSESQAKDGVRTEFTVLHTLKGTKSPSFTWLRKDANPLCGPGHQPGDIAVLFIDQPGSLHLCSGNFPLSAQLKSLKALLKATGQTKKNATISDLQAGLEFGLKGYLHDRKSIRAHHSSFKGRRTNLGTTKIVFRGKTKKTKPDAIRIDNAFRLGDIVYLNGFYASEGLAFEVLLRVTKGGYQLVHNDQTER